MDNLLSSPSVYLAGLISQESVKDRPFTSVEVHPSLHGNTLTRHEPVREEGDTVAMCSEGTSNNKMNPKGNLADATSKEENDFCGRGLSCTPL